MTNGLRGRVWNALLNTAVVGRLAYALGRPQGPVGAWIVERRDSKMRQAALAAGLWSSLTSASAVAPSKRTPVLVVFTDYECEFCRDQYVWLRERQMRIPESSIGVLHFPLPSHPAAGAAARAAMCADQVGFFGAMQHALMTRKEWQATGDFGALAHEIGLTDTLTFSACIRSPEAVVKLREQIVLGRQAGVDGTPYYVTAENGWFGGSLNERRLKQLTRGR